MSQTHFSAFEREIFELRGMISRIRKMESRRFPKHTTVCVVPGSERDVGETPEVRTFDRKPITSGEALILRKTTCASPAVEPGGRNPERSLARTEG